MQGRKLRVHPATWKRWRTLVSSHSIRRGPPILEGPQFGAGSGKGQKPAMSRWPSREILMERCGPQNQPSVLLPGFSRRPSFEGKKRLALPSK